MVVNGFVKAILVSLIVLFMSASLLSVLHIKNKEEFPGCLDT